MNTDPYQPPKTKSFVPLSDPDRLTATHIVLIVVLLAGIVAGPVLIAWTIYWFAGSVA
ncbi:MAG: hypothetical protein ABGZ35_14315 [Planctomycetaceae bacterium]